MLSKIIMQVKHRRWHPDKKSEHCYAIPLLSPLRSAPSALSASQDLWPPLAPNQPAEQGASQNSCHCRETLGGLFLVCWQVTVTDQMFPPLGTDSAKRVLVCWMQGGEGCL